LRIELHKEAGIGYSESVSIDREADDQHTSFADSPEFGECRFLTEYFTGVPVAALDAVDFSGDGLSRRFG
jgi:hypothetical protein